MFGEKDLPGIVGEICLFHEERGETQSYGRSKVWEDLVLIPLNNLCGSQTTLQLHLSHGLLTPLIATVTAPETGDCDMPLCPIQRLNTYLGIYPYLLSHGAEGISLELGRLMIKGIFAMRQHPASVSNIPFRCE